MLRAGTVTSKASRLRIAVFAIKVYVSQSEPQKQTPIFVNYIDLECHNTGRDA